ncbi:MAG: hypothetical protein ACYSUX_09375 [Planctomycetota bacterium]
MLPVDKWGFGVGMCGGICAAGSMEVHRSKVLIWTGLQDWKLGQDKRMYLMNYLR